MYFRKIKEAHHPLFYATNSAGAFVAAIKKMDVSDETSWQVATGPERNPTVKGEGLSLEDAFDLAELLEVTDS